MNVTLFTLEYPPFKGGVSEYYTNLVRYWPKNESSITVLNNNNNELIKKYIWPRWIFAYRALKRHVRNNNIDHIIVGHILPLGTVAFSFFKRYKISYSVILHGMDISYALKKKRKAIIAKKVLESAQSIICANSYTAKIVKKIISKEKWRKINIVNPGISASIKENTYTQTKIINKYSLSDKIVLFSLGRIVKRKGFDKVIEALPEVWKLLPNLVYFIAGKGPDENYLKQLASTHSNINFIGELDDENKWAWFFICDIFAMPSRNIEGDFEGFGIVYLEANLAGKPVIAGSAGGVADAVVDNLNGVIVDPEDPEMIANAIIELGQNNGLRIKMGENGRARAIRAFNWKNQILNIYNLISTVK